jgi:hypothetical protein
VAVEDRAGVGTLEGEHRVAVGDVADLHVEAARVVAQPGEVALVVGGVRDGQEDVAEAIGEEVVEHAAVVAAEDRVLRAAVGELRDVVGQDALEERLGVGPVRLHLAHVRDVEQARARAHGHVLGANALVLHRHLPAGERHEPRAECRVAIVKSSTTKRFGGGGQDAARLPAGRGRNPATRDLRPAT